MNKKIKELAEQAGFHFDEYNEPTQRKVDRLAELIVQESVDFLAQAACEYEAEMLRSYWDET